MAVDSSECAQLIRQIRYENNPGGGGRGGGGVYMGDRGCTLQRVNRILPPASQTGAS